MFSFQNTTDEDSMVVQYILASRTVTRSKINSENKSGAQESDTKPADIAKEKDDEKSSTNELEQSAEKEAENEDVKGDDEKEEDKEKEEEKVDLPEGEEIPKPTEKDVTEGAENNSEELANDDEKKDEDTEEVEEFYVKYRNFSYLHCEWKTEEELFKGDKRIATKLKRFKQKMAHNTNIFENVSVLFVISSHDDDVVIIVCSS